MKILFILFIISIYQLGFTEITYTSPLTQYIPGGEIKTINRAITITEKLFIIKSTTPDNAIHKKIFLINETSENKFPVHDLSNIMLRVPRVLHISLIFCSYN